MTTFWAGLGGSAGSAVGSIIGSKFGKKGKSRLSQSLAQIAHQNRVWKNAATNAPKYGIHPLIALGHQSYAPSGGGVGTGTQTESETGARLGSAIGQALGGRSERRANKLRQMKLDNMALQKHNAELLVLHSEANKNNAVADSAISSFRNRSAQKSNQQQDQVEVTMGRDERFPENKEHNLRIGGENWTVEGGTTGQTIEDVYGEAGSVLMIPKMYRDMQRNYLQPRVKKFYNEYGRKLKSGKAATRRYIDTLKHRNRTHRYGGTRR